MTPQAEPVVHVVLRNHFEETGAGLLHQPVPADEGDPVRAFADAARAAMWRDEMEHAERLKADPFQFAPPDAEQSNRTLKDRVRSAGLEPPPVRRSATVFEPAVWSQWWRERTRSESPERIANLWRAFGGHSFYTIVAVPLDGPPPEGDTLYVVRRLGWQQWSIGAEPATWLLPTDHSGRIVFGRPIRAFADRLDADGYRTRCDRQDRADGNPFAYWVGEFGDGPLASRTSLDYPRLHDWLLDCGAAHVPDWPATTEGWRAWWAREVPRLSPLQQARAWEAFDRLALYDVAEVGWGGGNTT